MSKKQPEIAYIGGMTSWVPPSSSTTTTASRKQNEQSITQRNEHYNKEDKSYIRETSKASHSSGSFGRGGYKDEYKVSNKYKVGNPEGFTEIYTEKRVRDVTYGNNNRITYDAYYSDPDSY